MTGIFFDLGLFLMYRLEENLKQRNAKRL